MTEDQVKTLQHQLAEERSLREEAEAKLQVWRQKALDAKFNAVKTRTELTEEVDIVAANSRMPAPAAGEDVAQLKRDNAALTKQRNQLLADLEKLRAVDAPEDSAEDEAVQKERRSRRASEAISSTLRKQLAESEKQRFAAETEAQRLRIDLDRMKNLLTAAEQIIVQCRGSGTDSNNFATLKVTPSQSVGAASSDIGARGLPWAGAEEPAAAAAAATENNHKTVRRASLASLAALAVGAVGTAGAVALRQSK